MAGKRARKVVAVIEASALAGPINALPGFDSALYKPHRLHSEDAVWVEKNCYIDIWIEILHALRLEPLAALSFTAAIDFEGDQWTFFKPPLEDLRELFGIDVQELNVWRPLLDHAAEHLSDGKLLASEVDSFWLPDTAGTDYRTNHVKTTIVFVELDVAARRLGYFHNAGYHRLEGEDFARIFGLDQTANPDALPLFAELIRADRVVRRAPRELALASRELLKKHMAHRPLSNPVARFHERFERDLPMIQERGLAFYHGWAFATLRQLGAATELLAQHLRWLEEHGAINGLEPAANNFEQVSGSAKAFILKIARAVNTKRPLDASALFGEMSAAWENGMAIIAHELERTS